MNNVDLYEGIDYDISRDYDKMSNIENIKRTIKDVVDILDGDKGGLKEMLLNQLSYYLDYQT